MLFHRVLHPPIPYRQTGTICRLPSTGRLIPVADPKLTAGTIVTRTEAGGRSSKAALRIEGVKVGPRIVPVDAKVTDVGHTGNPAPIVGIEIVVAIVGLPYSTLLRLDGLVWGIVLLGSEEDQLVSEDQCGMESQG
jgi:hypothetical protein